MISNKKKNYPIRMIIKNYKCMVIGETDFNLKEYFI